MTSTNEASGCSVCSALIACLAAHNLVIYTHQFDMDHSQIIIQKDMRRMN